MCFLLEKNDFIIFGFIIKNRKKKSNIIKIISRFMYKNNVMSTNIGKVWFSYCAA